MLESNSLRAAAIGAAIAAVMTLPGLGTGTLWDNSETAYGEVAREILLTHDAVVMHLNGYPWFVQPPLYFWLAALGAKVFGLTSFALRLPSALAAIGAAAVTAGATARVAGERAGILAAAILATGLMQAAIGRLAIMDALLDTAVACAIFAWFAAFTSPRRKTAPWLAGWAAIALGTLAKGVVAPAIAVAVLAVWFVWERRVATGDASDASPSGPAPLPALLGVVVAIAIVVPWAALEYAAVGPQAFGELIEHYTVGRYLGTIENQPGPFWYYVPVVVLGFFPWIAYLWPAARCALGERGPRASLGRLAIVWSAVPLLFFSFAKTKLPNYVALEMPALAVLVALWFDARGFATSRRTALRLTALVPVVFAALLAGMSLFTDSNRLGPAFAALKPDVIAFVSINLLGSLICFALFTTIRTAPFAPYALSASTIAAWLFIAIVAVPHAEIFKPVPKLAVVIDARRRAGDSVAIQGAAGGNALLFYTRPRVHALSAFGKPPETPLADPRRTICGGLRAFVIGPKKRPAFDPTFGRHRRVIASAASDVLMLYDGPACTRSTLRG